jgi:hypothetical protein
MAPKPVAKVRLIPAAPGKGSKGQGGKSGSGAKTESDAASASGTDAKTGKAPRGRDGGTGQRDLF